MDGKQLAVLVALIGTAMVLLNQHTATPVSEFESWKATHGITFDSQFENAYRERVFLENVAKVNAHNANPARTYDMGVNHFTHLTQDEFEQTYLGLIVPEEFQNIETNEAYTPNEDIDWDSKGFVTKVKNQGQCGSCWAFSTTGGLEGLSKAQGDLQDFSEQQLVDCSSSYGNHGCNGGLMTSALKFVKDNGIVHQNEYPYTARQGQCKTKTGPYKNKGMTEVKNCNSLSSAIGQRVVSVACDASNWSSYRGGVFNNCGTRLNHGITLTGVKDGNWRIKNSWGNGWGEKGYITLKSGNTCGVCNMAVYPE